MNWPLAMSDEIVVSIVTATFTFLGTVFTGIMTYLIVKLNRQAVKATKVLEVNNGKKNGGKSDA